VSAPAEAPTPWARARHAAALFAIDTLGAGVALRARAGPARDAWLVMLRGWLEPSAPVVRVPIGVSDDRLLGGLDLAGTLRAGRPVAEKGLLAEAHGGLLLLPMAERISAGAAARIAGVWDSGSVSVEREGLRSRTSARFGVVALDEGVDEEEAPPAALLDRLGYFVSLEHIGHRDIEDPLFDAHDIARARARLPEIVAPDSAIEALVAVAAALGVTSLRAPSHALRAARAAAALRGSSLVEEEDIASAASLVLAPRATRIPETMDGQDQAEPAPREEEGTDAEESAKSESATDSGPDTLSASDLEDIVLAAARAAIPADLLSRIAWGRPERTPASRSGKAGAASHSARRGQPIGTRKGSLGEGRLALVETLRAAAPWQRLRRATRPDGGATRIWVHADDFRIARFRQRRGATAIFVVDASGSAAMQRLAEAKGAIETLLADCYVRRDQVALVAFRGKAAELVLPPTRSLARAKRVLAGLPGGGGTPIAQGIETALALADQIRRRGQSPLLVLMTDGRANVGRDGAPGRPKAMTDALDAGRRVRAAAVAALAIDTAPPTRATEEAPTRRIAEAMNARYIKLPHADPASLSDAVRAAAPAR
jgi:magnesium chelatase subunit D